MDALRLLCLLAMPFYIAEHIAGQNGKPLGKWSAALADQYPNPLNDDRNKCKVTSPKRICDPNTVLDGNTRNRVNDEIKEFENFTFHQIANCHPPGVFVVALLNSIVNEAHDKGQETVAIAQQFHTIWRLNNCSAVFVVSNFDKTCGLVSGNTLKQFLPIFNTNSSVGTSSSICFTGNTFQSDLTTLMQCIIRALDEEIDQISTPETKEISTPETEETPFFSHCGQRSNDYDGLPISPISFMSIDEAL